MRLKSFDVAMTATISLNFFVLVPTRSKKRADPFPHFLPGSEQTHRRHFTHARKKEEEKEKVEKKKKKKKKGKKKKKRQKTSAENKATFNYQHNTTTKKQKSGKQKTSKHIIVIVIANPSQKQKRAKKKKEKKKENTRNSKPNPPLDMRRIQNAVAGSSVLSHSSGGRCRSERRNHLFPAPASD